MTGRVSHRDALDRIRAILRSESGVEESLREAVEALHEAEMYYNWVGIYLLEGEDLILAAWKGPQATEHTRIPIGKGVCGLAARTREVVNVTDVTKDPRYMACFPGTRSEIVVPILGSHGVLGEIDIDSDAIAAFSVEDESFLQAVAGELARALEF